MFKNRECHVDVYVYEDVLGAVIEFGNPSMRPFIEEVKHREPFYWEKCINIGISSLWHDHEVPRLQLCRPHGARSITFTEVRHEMEKLS